MVHDVGRILQVAVRGVQVGVLAPHGLHHAIVLMLVLREVGEAVGRPDLAAPWVGTPVGVYLLCCALRPRRCTQTPIFTPMQLGFRTWFCSRAVHPLL